MKDEVEDFVSEEESKFRNGRWELAILLLLSGQQSCQGILIVLWVDGKTLQTLCVELTYFSTLHTFKVSVSVSAVKLNKEVSVSVSASLAKQGTCWWQKMDLTMWNSYIQALIQHLHLQQQVEMIEQICK